MALVTIIMGHEAAYATFDKLERKTLGGPDEIKD